MEYRNGITFRNQGKGVPAAVGLVEALHTTFRISASPVLLFIISHYASSAVSVLIILQPQDRPL